MRSRRSTRSAPCGSEATSRCGIPRAPSWGPRRFFAGGFSPRGGGRPPPEYAGAVEQVAALAARTEPNAVFIFDPDDVGIRLAAPLRFLHGRDSYIVWDPAATTQLRAFLETVHRDRRPVYYVTSTPGPATA